ncbi:MAG: HAD hydrolase family protein [Caldilineales bacterium]|nr:HAD hydrolase family protein [Caldilineales bacterium]
MTDSLTTRDAALLQRIRAIRLLAFDFDGVFTDNAVYVFEDGREAVRCSRADGIGLRKIERLGILLLIISSEPNPVVAARSQKLRVRCIQNCADKRQALAEVAAAVGVTLAEAAFVGNDINDLPVLQAVGLPIIVQDAHPDVVAVGRYRTRRPGGYGAVREVCDLFEQALTRAVEGSDG